MHGIRSFHRFAKVTVGSEISFDPALNLNGITYK